jgi:integrase/recombinase XerD
VTLERSRLDGNTLFLHQSKTGVPVCVVLPPELAEDLREIPPGLKPNPRYFFWDGDDKDRAVEQWVEAFCQLFETADLRQADGTPKRCHGQMIRDTFAVELLLAGVRIEEVSALLGHSSILITQQRYLPWVRARQQQLEESVRKAHMVPGITKSAQAAMDERRPSLFDVSPTARDSKSKKVS